MDNRKVAHKLLALAKSLIASPKSRLDTKTVSKLQKICYKYSTGHGNGNIYYDAMPVGPLFEELHNNGVHAIDDDGTVWSGFLVGREGHANIELAPFVDKNTAGQVYDNVALHLNWMKMGSGRYEFLCRVG